jgi:hypothetical protein
MYPSSPGIEDHDDDVDRPFVPGFDGIERRAALMRNPIFTDIFSVLTRGADATMSWTPTPTSSPRPARRRCRRSVVYDPNGHPTLLVATSHQCPPFLILTRRFSCPFPRNPAPFLQTKIIVVLAIHLPTDSYPQHNLYATESLEGPSTVHLQFPSSRPAFSRRALIFNICSIARFLTALSLAPTSAAYHVHTHHVRQRPRTLT